MSAQVSTEPTADFRPPVPSGPVRLPAHLLDATSTSVFVPEEPLDQAAEPRLARLRAFLEIKTVWHPTGALPLSGGGSY